MSNISAFDAFMEKAVNHIPSERFRFIYSFEHPLVGEASKPSRMIWFELTLPEVYTDRYRRLMSLLLRKWVKHHNHEWSYTNGVHYFTLTVSEGPAKLTMLGQPVETPFVNKVLNLLQ